jgi:YD repeat-containing protein
MPGRLKGLCAVALVAVCVSLAGAGSAWAGWRAVPSGASTALTGVAFGDATHGWITVAVDLRTSKNNILSTGTGGDSWSALSYRRFREYLNDIAAADSSHVWAAGSWNVSEAAGSTVIGSVDGGQTWSDLYSETQGQSLWGVACTDSSHVWAVGDCGEIVASTDGGATWRVQRRQGSYTNVLYDVSFPAGDHGWAVGSRGQILATADAGTTWRAQRSGTSRSLLGVSFVSETRGWAVGAKGTILTTSDGGAHWSRQRSGTDEALRGVAFLAARVGWAVGGAGTILRTSDGGATWRVTYRASRSLTAVTCTKDGRVIAVGAHGTVLVFSR